VPDDTREAILDAAARLITASEWPRTRMADIAASAGISRQTIYNEFGNREGLLQALQIRESQRFVDEVVRAAREAPGDIGNAVEAAIVAGVGAAVEDPEIKAVLGDRSGELLPLLTTRSGVVVAMLTDGVTAVLVERWPHLDPVETRWSVELCVRLGLSHVVLRTEPVEVTAAHVAIVMRRLLRDAKRRS
jgi:AcrR family transcriptional regulator